MSNLIKAEGHNIAGGNSFTKLNITPLNDRNKFLPRLRCGQHGRKFNLVVSPVVIRLHTLYTAGDMHLIRTGRSEFDSGLESRLHAGLAGSQNHLFNVFP